MDIVEESFLKTKENALKLAVVLSIITIFYNIAEGIVAVFFGISDDTLALFGFGLDSFVEVISGVGIFLMLMRMNNAGHLRGILNDKDNMFFLKNRH
ncbi:MAG: hypothetical protein L3V56_14340 [Candidatus Magnetoovum sp. WYHC-5]|nr:hypothetical protein [Candidatus Magnetoovum sp. WYHC-5]